MDTVKPVDVVLELGRTVSTEVDLALLDTLWDLGEED